MTTELHDYDAFPKVLPEGRPATITIRPVGGRPAFAPGDRCQIRIAPIANGHFGLDTYRWRGALGLLRAVVGADGALRFDHVFRGEQTHNICVFAEGDDLFAKPLAQVAVYSLREDLLGLYPFRGDLHMHTFRSDGKNPPAVVAADYRKAGYDFSVVSDHGRYYPALEAIRAYEGVPTEFAIVPGEEIHLRGNDVHLVNFGSAFSVNGLVRTSPQVAERGEAPSERAIIPNPPPVLDEEEYIRQVNGLVSSLDIPDGIEAFTYASCCWIFDRIREGGGAGVFAHPFWFIGAWQIPEDFTRFMLERHPFDAFEVLGGGTAFQQNCLQVALYNEMRAKGIDFPVVGSTDSHLSCNNPGGMVASTILLARDNTREALVEAVRRSRSVALDTLSGHYRLVGDYRLTKYAEFLLEHFFPLHDELCFEEGRAMKDYATGVDPRAGDYLRCIHGRMRAQRRKYFAFADPAGVG